MKLMGNPSLGQFMQRLCLALFASSVFVCPVAAADRDALLQIQKRLEAAEARLKSLEGHKALPQPKVRPALPQPKVQLAAPSSPDLNDPLSLSKALGKAIPSNHLEPRIKDGETLACEPRLRLPYTGWAKQIGDHGRVKTLLHFKDGKLDGPFTIWRDNGWQLAQAYYRKGKQDGPATAWHANGRKSEDRHYVADKLMSATVWKPNGEKCPHTKILAGNGVVVRYHPDGTTDHRETFRNGVRVE